MEFIDTHAHLFHEQYQDDLPAVIKETLHQGIKKVYLPNLTLETIAPMITLEQEYPNLFKSMLGLHPCHVTKNFQEDLKKMSTWFTKHTFSAIGEVGLDLYWDKTYHQEQRNALHIAIDWALTYQLPLILHARNSIQEVISVIRKRQKGNLTGIFHCFSGTLEEAHQIISLGFYIGVGGVVTFKKSPLPPIIEKINLAHIVLETDSPYLAPSPHRGKRNHPGYLPIIAQKIAEIKSCPLREVAKQTSLNARKIFKN